jgi:hypothetical protein
VLKNDEVPEHPGCIGFGFSVALHQVLNDGNVKDALIANSLFG